MLEPQFLVPLSALVEIEPSSHPGKGWIWSCRFECGGSSGYGDYPSKSAARVAATAHLVSVHGIVPTTSAQALDKALDNLRPWA